MKVIIPILFILVLFISGCAGQQTVKTPTPQPTLTATLEPSTTQLDPTDQVTYSPLPPITETPTIVTSRPSVCGNNIIENNEDCDGVGCNYSEICSTSCKCEKLANSEFCKDVIVNGLAEDKLDVVFVPDYSYSQYSDFKIFAEDVNKQIQAILKMEPFKSLSNKINFRRVDKLNDKLKCGLSQSECDQPSRKLASECPYDKIITLVKSGISGYAFLPRTLLDGLAIAGTCDNSTSDFYGNSLGCPYFSIDYQQLTMIHELGHAFGLADMYLIVANLLNQERFPNCDVKGCPKWCSSFDISKYEEAFKICESRTQSDCLGNAVNKYDESGKVVGYLYRCGLVDDKCVVREGNENVGVDCQSNTGCYFNCGSLLAWRPVERGSMMYGEEPAPGDEYFDQPSLDYLKKELNKYK